MNVGDYLINDLLAEAIENDNVTNVMLALYAGADPNTVTDGNMPVLYAACQNSEETALLLLECGANPKVHINGYTTLMVACNNEFVELAKKLISMNVNIDSKDFTGENALFKAVRRNNAELVAILLKAGMEVGQTVFYIAIQRGYTEIVHLLESYVNNNLPKGE